MKVKKPRLQWANDTSVRQYVISDSPPIVYHSHQTSNTGIPSVVWQQQMEKAYIRRYNNMHIIHKTLPTYEYDYTDIFDTQFRPLPEVVAYDTYFVDRHYGLDPYWDEELYDQDKLEYKETYNEPNDQNQCDDLITDAHVSDALRHALIDLWTVNPHLPDTSALPNIQPRPQNQQRQTAVIDDQILPQLQVTPDGLTRFLPLSTNLPLKNEREMLYFPMVFGELNIDGLIDTGALSSAIPEADLRKIRLLAPPTILNEGPRPEFQIMVANEQLEARIGTVELQFKVGDITFREKFIVMTNLTCPLIGLLLLQRNSSILDMRQGILNFPFFSMQLKNGDRTYPNVIGPILNPVDTMLQPGKRTTIWVESQIYTENEATGIIQPSPLLENDEDLPICPAISSTQNNKHIVQISNFLDHPYTLKKGTHMANLSILTPEQSKHIRPVNPTSVRHLLNNNHDDAIHYIYSLLKTSQTEKVNETYWFRTPHDPGNEKEHTPIQTRILNELRELEKLEKLNPLEYTDSRNQFLSNFDWTDSNLQPDAKQAVENLLVEFHDFFARHCFYIGINTEFKVQITSLDNRPAYSQSPPAPMNLKDDILVELALLHKYGIITTLPFSKYASPIFAQRKPNGKLRLLVDLRKINTLIADDYINNNHPVSTLTDAAQHMAGKNLFCKLDCSQAYHCLQMADQQSIELFAFNFASRTFAYQRLTQRLSRSLSAFSSFIREYLDPAIKADQCAQYVDDIGIAANTPEQLIKNLRAVFQCLRKAGLKLSIAKCHFGVQEVGFFGRTITTKGVAPQKQKVTKFLERVKFPRSKKAFQRYIVFLNYYRNYIPRLAERLTPFFQLLKTTDIKTKIPITPDIMKEFREINEAQDRCCQLALRQPLPGKQLVLMTDASFQAAGYAVLIEDDPNQKYTSTRKTYAPIAYGSKTYSPSQIKMSIYAKEFLAIYMAFKEFGHKFWGATKPVIIMTYSKSVTRFFQTKMSPPPLWNACDFVLQFNFTIAHIPGKMNTAAVFFISFGNGSK